MKFALHDGELIELGGKALSLLQLEQAGLPIPPWFAVPPSAFTASLKGELALAVSAGDQPLTGPPLSALQLSEEVRKDVHDALNELDECDACFAVRSSAVEEDGTHHSFAGQLETFLFVRPESVFEKVAEVWRSGFSDRVIEYRRQNGLDGVPPTAPAVLIQRMVNASAAGVAFSADPISGRRSLAVVSAVPGLGTALVGGEAAADVFKVDRAGKIVDRMIVRKDICHRFDPNAPEGVSAIKLSEAETARPALTDEQVVAVAQLARRAAHHFGQPQDIEWAIAGHDLFLLQSRPITTLRNLSDPEGALNLWDNSNITESYNGITTPLTFSFARYVYEGVYRQFCRILRVPERKIEKNHRTFSSMLGLVRGRVYYNLLNWYRVLALLPGFTLNRRFMEQMMGVRESLPDEIVGQLDKATGWERLVDAFRTLHMVAGLVRSYLTLDGQVAKFYGRLNRALETPNPPFEDMRLDELVAHYYQLEEQLLSRWDAPLVNDFFAMIFHGALRNLTQRWCGDDNGMLANEAIRGQADIVSLEPAARLHEMAAVAATHSELAIALREGYPTQLMRLVRQYPEFESRYQAYLDKFGDRCLEELKLESETLRDNPLVLLRNIGEVARAAHLTRSQPVGESSAEGAEQKIRSALLGSPIRRRFLLWVLKQARARVRNRENLRFERTRLFGTIRRVVVEAGRRLQAIGQLDEARDVFYLELQEILAFNNGTATTADIRSLARLRKLEFERYRKGAAPADRFETRGPVYHAQAYASSKPNQPMTTGDERTGLGCCPGTVRAKTCVIRDPKNARVPAGCILVADHTDPGWIMLFPSASGLLVERGSLLSHSAIVARELGIPAVISIPGLLDWLHDGDEVELDGASGVVRVLRRKEHNA
jgi:rifampicin phosphotransferase